MKRLKTLIAAFAMACLLSVAVTAASGTMTSGGDVVSPTPSPTPATMRTVPEAEAEQQIVPPADEATTTFEAIRDVMIQLASWVIW